MSFTSRRPVFPVYTGNARRDFEAMKQAIDSYLNLLEREGSLSIDAASVSGLTDGLTTQILVGGGTGVAPVWTTATGTGAPVRAASPTFTGTVTADVLTATGTTTLGNTTCDALTVSGAATVEQLLIRESQASALIEVKLDNSGAAADDEMGYGFYSNNTARARIKSVVQGAGSGFEGDLEFWTGLGSLTKKLEITWDGRLYGTALHNNTGSLTGTTNQYIASGDGTTYSPTGVAGTNTTSITLSGFKYTRLGNVVKVSGRARCNRSSINTATFFYIPLPIASNLTSDTLHGVANGVFSDNGSVGTYYPLFGGYVTADAANDRALVVYYANADTHDELNVMFEYVVL